MKIDSHQHFWTPARGDYDWMPKDDPILSRQYLPRDLAPLLQGAGIEQTVLVQAAATVQESEYMLGLADGSDFVAGVVGWVDFEKPKDLAHMTRLSHHPKFLGLRPMIQDIPDDHWMARNDIAWAFRAICDLDLTFDALGFPRHLDPFLALFKRFPDLRVVVDHGMKPQIRDPAGFAAWAEGIARIAGETGAFVKFSALITEDGPDWSVARLRPYVDHILSVFGPERVMWGSDWPVCLLRASYGDWHQAALDLTQHLSDSAKAQIFGGTAARFYRI
jgi:L-fuconolactonase